MWSRSRPESGQTVRGVQRYRERKSPCGRRRIPSAASGGCRRRPGGRAKGRFRRKRLAVPTLRGRSNGSGAPSDVRLHRSLHHHQRGCDRRRRFLDPGARRGKRWTSRSTTAGANGRIKANIFGRSVTVEGEVEGDLRAEEQIAIRKSGRVLGNVSAPRVTIEDGAMFKGSIEMERKPAPRPAVGPAGGPAASPIAGGRCLREAPLPHGPASRRHPERSG